MGGKEREERELVVTVNRAVPCVCVCLPNHFCIFRADGGAGKRTADSTFSVTPAAGDSSRAHCHHSLAERRKMSVTFANVGSRKSFSATCSMAVRTIGHDEVDRRKGFA